MTQHVYDRQRECRAYLCASAATTSSHAGLELAHYMGSFFANQMPDWEICFGAGDKGGMRAFVAPFFEKEENDRILGIIHAAVAKTNFEGISPELRRPDGRLLIVPKLNHDMREIQIRQCWMNEESDLAIIQPGGAGTLVEVTELLCFIDRGLLNTNILLVDFEKGPGGFWQPLIDQLKVMNLCGALPEHVAKRIFHVSRTAEINSILDGNIAPVIGSASKTEDWSDLNRSLGYQIGGLHPLMLNACALNSSYDAFAVGVEKAGGEITVIRNGHLPQALPVKNIHAEIRVSNILAPNPRDFDENLHENGIRIYQECQLQTLQNSPQSIVPPIISVHELHTIWNHILAATLWSKIQGKTYSARTKPMVLIESPHVSMHSHTEMLIDNMAKHNFGHPSFHRAIQVIPHNESIESALLKCGRTQHPLLWKWSEATHKAAKATATL